jgi:hypothetical protein
MRPPPAKGIGPGVASNDLQSSGDERVSRLHELKVLSKRDRNRRGEEELGGTRLPMACHSHDLKSRDGNKRWKMGKVVRILRPGCTLVLMGQRLDLETRG